MLGMHEESSRKSADPIRDRQAFLSSLMHCYLAKTFSAYITWSGSTSSFETMYCYPHLAIVKLFTSNDDASRQSALR